MSRLHSRHAGIDSAFGTVSLPDRGGRDPSALACACGGEREFETDSIGRLVERCRECGRGVVYPGGRMLTRADLIDKYGATDDGEPRRQRRGVRRD